MDEGSRRHGSGPSKKHPKKQKSGLTVASASTRSHRSPGGLNVQKRDLSASTATGDQLVTAHDLVTHSELPTKRSIFTEAESIWHDDGSKLFSVAVQPTEAHLNTHVSFMDLGTNASVGATSAQDEKGEEVSETMGLTASLGRDAQGDSLPAAVPDMNRQHEAGSPDFAPGDSMQPDKTASKYTRRWDSAPNPRRALDDSALEVDNSQLRTSRSRQERDKRLKTPDLAKLQSRGILEGSSSHQVGAEPSGQQPAWNPKVGRANQDPALKELGTNPTDIQIAAKQTGFLQRHVSHKAERQHNFSTRLNEDNLNSLEPRKEQRIDPKERILAWIEQGEAHLQSYVTPQPSTQDFSGAPGQPVESYQQNPTGQASVSTRKEARSKASKGSRQKKTNTGGGVLGCFGCLSSA